jgi:uncharacterized membrane protein
MVSIARNVWETLSGSYWFIPAVLGVIAVLLSIVTVTIDQRIGDDWIVGLDMLVFAPMQGAGARAVLTTIAASMITVAGVVFSLTLLVLTQASSQFGPRRLLNFMHDRTNQIMLGAFVATFVYALLVLRVVTDGADGGGSVAFVPQVSVLTSLVLAFATVGLLVYFFHHIAESVRATHVLGDVDTALQDMLDDLPEPGGSDEPAAEDIPTNFRDDVGVIDAKRGGYLQSVAVKTLVNAAVEHDAVVRVLPTVGSFVTRGAPVAEVHPAAAVAAVQGAVHRSVTTGNDRSLTQDLGFVFDELLEIALRALSPSMNDPFTARACIDRIAQGLLRLDRCGLPGQVHVDDDGVVRAFVPLQGSGPLTRHLFAELRRASRGNLFVTQHLLEAMALLRRLVRTAAIGAAIEDEIEALMHDAETTLSPGDHARLVAVMRRSDATIGSAAAP